VAAFFVAILRILWALSQPKPAALHPDRKAETFLAELVHWLLYASLVIVPLSGWLHHAATSGFAPIFWPLGQNLPFVPKSDFVAEVFAGMHFIFTKVLAISIFLHIAGALKHVFLDKDGTLARMTKGYSGDVPAPKDHSRTPMLAAFAIYAAGLIAAFALTPSHEASAASNLEAVAGDWQVQDGKIEISVVQLGAKVTGSFAEWTAAISFDEVPTDGSHGSADVTIAIGSLTLGSVTAQALGAGFFEADTFPTHGAGMGRWYCHQPDRFAFR